MVKHTETCKENVLQNKRNTFDNKYQAKSQSHSHSHFESNRIVLTIPLHADLKISHALHNIIKR